MKPLIIFILIFLTYCAHAQQTFFHSEKPIQRPIKIPLAIIKMLQQTEGNIHDVCGVHDSLRDFAAVEGSYVNLANHLPAAILIRQYSAGMNVPFWIFQQQNGSWKLIFTDNALEVSVQPIPLTGYRQLKVASCWYGGCHKRLYKYNDTAYYQADCVEITAAGKKPCK